ncbi:MAG: branched-chain amino acid ABC transporter permease [Alphaproteobacteria bacterium]|nr:branched-chain amino acid ABC transporter permease [Alphaproteobacteria bacterium]
MESLLGFGIFFVSFAGIYAILALGLNVQWGYTGLFNIGIAAFFAVGAYTAAILTTPESPNHLGGFGLPMIAGFVVAMLVAAVLALAIGLITLRLREDYLAIASIGLAEIVRLVLKNEEWLTNGTRGITAIPRPTSVTFFVIVAVAVLVTYWLVERARRSPWGRTVRAVREQEQAALAAGKNVVRFRLEAFVFGSALMGLAGALYAHFQGFVGPEAFEPMFGTFIVWVMLIAGGSGNNRGALVGAFLVWGLYAVTGFVATLVPPEFATQASAARVVLVGVLLIVVLLYRPEGLLPESRRVGPGPD